MATPSRKWIGPSGIDFVEIPAGTFCMGAGDNEEALPAERPRHVVTLSHPLLLGIVPVTQEQWCSLASSDPDFEIDEDHRHTLFLHGKLSSGNNPSLQEGLHGPVECVRWWDCLLFCNRLSIREGLVPCYDERSGSWAHDAGGYRLPTEAEWECACRAGTTTSYYWGDDPRPTADHAWFEFNSGRRRGSMSAKVAGSERPHDVGGLRPNSWGLRDMCGNVTEWCFDWFDERYYGRSAVRDPTGPVTGTCRVLRGGNYSNFASQCRSASRSSWEPDTRRGTIGFRLCRTVLTGK